MIAVLFSVVLLGAVVFALVDIILRDESQIKHLPKIAWVLLVVFLPLVGTGLWLILGREYAYRSGGNVSFGDPSRWKSTDKDARSGRSVDSRSTEEQLADLEREIQRSNQNPEGIPDR
ncbi:PLDc N-terminal domain-containing protein [Subtercola boreus]|nr:PLDc N-terminal domain-containing protein [Subtercola boreus]